MSRVCTLFWPPTGSCQSKVLGPPSQSSAQRQTFIIGWNPRGFVIAVGQIVSAMHIEEVLQYIKEVYEISRLSNEGVTSGVQRIPLGLEIIGRIHPDRVAYDSADDSDAYLQMREKAGLWLEMESRGMFLSDEQRSQLVRGRKGSSNSTVSGPRIIAMYMCGYRQQCELHLIRLKSEEVVPVAPVILSPLSRLSVQNVIDIVGGKTATVLLRGAESVLEGPLLPPHCVNVMQRFPGTAEDRPAPENRSMTPTGTTPSRSVGESPRRESMSDHGGSFSSTHDLSNDSLPGVIDESPHEISASDIDASIPPRLQFPTAASFTEFSRVMECVAAGAQLRKGNDSHRSFRTRYPAIFRHGSAVAIALLTVLLAVVSRISPWSYVFNLLEYKLRELINALAVVGGSATACGMHPILPHRNSADPSVATGEQRRCLRNFAARVVADMVVGMFLCTLMDWYRAPITHAIRQAAWYGLHDMHRQYFDWFLGWPAGFKMNDALTQFLGLLCHSILSVWEYLVSLNTVMGFDWLDAGYTVLEALTSFGASFAVAWIADVCNLVTLHLRNMFHLLALPYRMVLQLLSTLFLQFRSQSHNPLRNRREEKSFSADEMLLGMMLFTLCVFLFPTVAIYYFYLASARTVIWILQEFLRGSSVLFCNLPIYSLYLWLVRRNILSNGITLSTPHVFAPHDARSPPSSPDFVATPRSSSVPLSPVVGRPPGVSQPSMVIEFDLISQPMAFGDIFKELRILTMVLFAATFSPKRILSFIVHANMKPIIDVNTKVFGHLVADPKSPKLALGK